jgi:hypothetical protein
VMTFNNLFLALAIALTCASALVWLMRRPEPRPAAATDAEPALAH